MHRLLIFLSLAGVAMAQTGFEGPVLGLVQDAAHGEVMRIEGAAGSARLVGVGARFEVAAVHAGRGWVLGRTASDQPLIFGANGVPVEGSLRGAKAVVFSESGSVAAAWYPDLGVVQIIGGMPGAPAVSQELAVDQADGLAVSDNGRMLAVRTASEILVLGGVVQHPSHVHGDAGPNETDAVRQTAAVSGAVDIRFVSGSRDLLIATPASVLVWRPAAKAPAVVAEGFDGLRAAWLSPDRKSLIGVQGQSVLVRELGSGSTATYECSCRPDRLVPLAAQNTLLISAAQGEPLWVFEAGTNRRILFIPARAVEAGQ